MQSSCNSTQQQQEKVTGKDEKIEISAGPGRSSSIAMTETGGALTFTVKPFDAKTDLDIIDKSIHALESNLPGVRFAKTFVKEDIAFGIKALTVTAFIPPDMSADTVFDWVRELKAPDNENICLVSSVDLIAFQNA